MSLFIIPANQSRAVQRGLASPQLQRQTGRYSPTTGWSFDQEFHGLSIQQMVSLAQQYADGGCEYELTWQAGRATLKTTDNRGEVTIDTWEIGVAGTLASSLKNPRNVDAIPSAYLEIIATAFKDGLTLQEAHDKLEEDTGDIYADDIATIPEAIRLYKRMLEGSDSYFYDLHTLRHTTNASSRDYYNVADFNVNCIYTQAQFYNEITNADDWIFPAPASIIGALDIIFSELPAAPAYYLNGALKGGSPRSTTSWNRINVVTEYKIFTWSTDEYATL